MLRYITPITRQQGNEDDAGVTNYILEISSYWFKTAKW